MKFIMCSHKGSGPHILYEIMLEGNEVELYFSNPKYKDNWEGILPKAESLPLDKEAVYIFDSADDAKIAQNLIDKGYNVVGSSTVVDKLEFDREYGIEIMQAAEIEVPFTKTFDNFKDVYEFLKTKRNQRFVFKPSGKDIPCHLSYVPQEGEDILRYIKYVEKAYKGIKNIEVQEFVEGISISTEGWFNGFHFIRPFNHTLEKKRFSDGDLGPAVGCAGNVVWACEEDEIVKKLINIEPYIKGYIGPIDINVMLNETGFYGLEFSPRIGYDAIASLLNLFKMEIGKLFADLARHQFDGEMALKELFSAALRVTVPPYPEEADAIPGLPIELDEDDISENSSMLYYFYDVALTDEGLVHSGKAGQVLCTLGASADLAESMDIATEHANDLIIPNKNYRTDLSEVINEDYKKFEEMITYATNK